MVAAITRTLTRAVARSAPTLQFAGLHETEQQALHAQRHLADLVQEHRAAVGHLELALLVAVGAGEGAPHVPKQFRFEQGFRQPGAVHRHHRARRARALAVNGVRHELLADAALAGNQYLGVGFGDPIDLFRQLDNRRALADQVSIPLRSHRLSSSE